MIDQLDEKRKKSSQIENDITAKTERREKHKNWNWMKINTKWNVEINEQKRTGNGNGNVNHLTKCWSKLQTNIQVNGCRYKMKLKMQKKCTEKWEKKKTNKNRNENSVSVCVRGSLLRNQRKITRKKWIWTAATIAFWNQLQPTARIAVVTATA